MFENLTPEDAITFTRRSVILNCCWPINKNATRFQIIRYTIFRCIVILNAFVHIYGTGYAAYFARSNVTVMCMGVSNALSTSTIIIFSAICIFKEDRLQSMIDEMAVFCTKAEPDAKSVLQRYLARYSKLYVVATTWFYVTGTAYVVGPLFLQQPFPGFTKYHFRVDFEPVTSIIYIHQTVVILQCAARICLNVLSALLLLFSAARFEILSNELSAVRDNNSLIEIWKKYHAARRFAQEAVTTIKLMSLSTIIFRGVLLLSCGITWMGQRAFTVRLQLLFVSGASLLEVFICALPADKLMDVSENVTRGIYNCAWYQRPIRLQKSILCMLIPQKPVAISVKCIISALSMNYFSSFVSNVFSFLTTLRVLINDES